MAKPEEYLVVVKAQIEQMAQYGQVLVATAGVMMSIIGGLVVINHPGRGAVWFELSVALLIVSLFAGFLGYGYVVSSFHSSVPFEEFMRESPIYQTTHLKDLTFAGSEAVLARKTQFESIRWLAFIQFISILLGSVLFLVGFT